MTKYSKEAKLKGMAKYDKLRKVSRELVADYRKLHPDWSLQEIADALHISRQRISQILQAIKVKAQNDA